MIFEIYPSGVFQANTYIIGDEGTGIGAVVDPGGDANGILSLCQNLNIKTIKYIILTHGHGDHIGAAAEIKEKTGAMILLNQRDEFLVKGGNARMSPMFSNIKPFDVDASMEDGDILEVGEMKIKVIETPGHTPGGVCLQVGKILITGDTLFRNSIGRTDFEGSSHEDLIENIKGKLLILDEGIEVYPGHGPSSTIALEKMYNPFL